MTGALVVLFYVFLAVAQTYSEAEWKVVVVFGCQIVEELNRLFHFVYDIGGSGRIIILRVS